MHLQSAGGWLSDVDVDEEGVRTLEERLKYKEMADKIVKKCTETGSRKGGAEPR
ncbi:MAG: hypothetical protein ACP5KA_06455 [Desulfurococcaceae archaeon]